MHIRQNYYAEAREKAAKYGKTETRTIVCMHLAIDSCVCGFAADRGCRCRCVGIKSTLFSFSIFKFMCLALFPSADHFPVRSLVSARRFPPFFALEEIVRHLSDRVSPFDIDHLIGEYVGEFFFHFLFLLFLIT